MTTTAYRHTAVAGDSGTKVTVTAGGGRDTSVVADSGGPVAGSTYGGLTGLANASGRGVAISIVLEPTG
jgi:hypothetical protein